MLYLNNILLLLLLQTQNVWNQGTAVYKDGNINIDDTHGSDASVNFHNEAKGGFGTDIRYNVGDKVKVLFTKGWQNGTVVNIQGPKYDTVMYDIKMDDGKLQKSIAQYHMDNA